MELSDMGVKITRFLAADLAWAALRMTFVEL